MPPCRAVPLYPIVGLRRKSFPANGGPSPRPAAFRSAPRKCAARTACTCKHLRGAERTRSGDEGEASGICRKALKAGDEIIGIQGLVRTLTCCLVTSSSKVCLDAIPIPAQTNEMGHFAQAFRELIAQYGRSDLFQMVTLDAGFNSAENATLIHDAGYGYLVRLSDERRDLMASAVRRLATSPPTKPPLKPRSSWARPP